MARVIAYCRVSLEKMAEKGVSLDAQQQKLRDYCRLFEHDLVEVIVDAGASAKDLDREGLQRALALLKGKKADALLVVKLDRVTRSVRDLCDLIERSRKEGWALMSVAEQIDTSTAAGRMVVNMLGVIAAWERESTAERTSAALRYKASRGEFVGGRAARFGYRLAADGVHLAPVEAEQAAVAEARRLRATGLSLRKVAHELAGKGLLARNGRPFQATQIARMVA